jgi:hypothetical protein
VLVADKGGIGATLISLDYFGHDAMLTFSLVGSGDLIKARVAGHSGYSVGQNLTISHQGPIRFFGV